MPSFSRLAFQGKLSGYFAAGLGIALAAIIFGLLPGIALGLVVTIFLFALEYSRMDVIKQELSADIQPPI